MGVGVVKSRGKKFTFAISSPDQLLVLFAHKRPRSFFYVYIPTKNPLLIR